MNPSTQPALEPAEIDPLYAFRDDLEQTLTPANSYERMLLTTVAQSWVHYQQAQDLKRRVFEKTDPFDLISNHYCPRQPSYAAFPQPNPLICSPACGHCKTRSPTPLLSCIRRRAGTAPETEALELSK